MLYITLILIASGLFLIIYSLFIEPSEKPFTPNIDFSDEQGNGSDHATANPQPEIDTSKDLTEFETETILGEEDSFDEYDLSFDNLDISGEYDLNDSTIITEEKNGDELPQKSDLFEDIGDMIDDEIDNKREKKEQLSDKITDNNYSAVLYEDSSNIFDYEKNNSIIDSTLQEYQKIKRIGKGNVELKKDGINFTIEKKLFRYDFHRIDNIVSGNNYFSLFLKRSDVARLFIFDKNTSIGFQLKQMYNEHSQGK